MVQGRGQGEAVSLRSNSIPVTRSSLPPFEEYCREIKELWETRWLTNRGEKHFLLERALESCLNVRCVSLFVNGHSALECALEALGIGRDGRDEVITTPFTFASTTNAIVRKGLQPVFADIYRGNCTIDVASVESLVTERTGAIMPVHVYGNICDVDSLERLARKFDLKLIYDAAHAFGACVGDRSVASYGDASVFSFHATKIFNSIEGGAVCYSDPNLRAVLERFANFGLSEDGEIAYPGGNAKLNEFSAAMGLCNLRHFDEELEKRERAVKRYQQRLGGLRAITLCGDGGFSDPYFSYMPIAVDSAYPASARDELFRRLAEYGIKTRKYFYPLTSESSYIADSAPAKSTPVAFDMSRRVLTLPLYADLTTSDVDRVCDALLDALGKIDTATIGIGIDE